MTAPFTKPRDRLPTRHLFLGNCGPAVGISEEAIELCLQQFGKVSVTVPDPTQARVFATFEDPASAQQAAITLQQPLAELGSRLLAVKFAALVAPGVVSSTTRAVHVDTPLAVVLQNPCGHPIFLL